MKYNTRIVVAYFKECGLPEPIPELVFWPGRKWRFDFAWIDQKVALEVQGGCFVRGGHVRGGQLRKEHEKRNAACMSGWRILYVFPEDLCMKDTVDMINASLVTVV